LASHVRVAQKIAMKDLIGDYAEKLWRLAASSGLSMAVKLLGIRDP